MSDDRVSPGPQDVDPKQVDLVRPEHLEELLALNLNRGWNQTREFSPYIRLQAMVSGHRHLQDAPAVKRILYGASGRLL